MRISPAHGSNMVPLGCLDHSTARESTWLRRMMKASHSHEAPILDGENPWFPDMSCRFSMIFPSTHPLHDRIWTFAGNVERTIASKCINGQRAFHHGVKFWEPGSKLFTLHPTIEGGAKSTTSLAQTRTWIDETPTQHVFSAKKNWRDSALSWSCCELQGNKNLSTLQISSFFSKS